jgi:hypothetical protein
MAPVLKGSLPSVNGSYFPQGLRVGPKCPPPSSLSSAAGLRDTWGPGMNTGQLFTYRILPTGVPYVEPTVAASAADASIVAQIPNLQTVYPAITSPVKLALSGSANRPGTAAKYFVSQGGSSLVPSSLIGISTGPVPVLQLDFPRCVSITTGFTMTTPGGPVGPFTATCNVYGYDYYMQPMMETIVSVNASTGVAISTLETRSKKAFYGITAAYLVSVNYGVAPPAGVAAFSLQIGVSNSFGLPYALSSAAHIIGYSQGSLSIETSPYFVGDNAGKAGPEGSYIFPTNQSNAFPPAVTSPATATSLAPYAISTPERMVAADRTTVTAASRDVRGTVAPLNSVVQTSYTNYVVIGGRNDWSGATNNFITVSYYVAGGDQQIDQQLERQKVLEGLGGYDALGTNPIQGLWKPVFKDLAARTVGISSDTLKGYPQYYENPPNA